MSKTISPRQKKYLRGLAHHLDPVVYVADKGLSDSVLAEIDRALTDHELIKVKLRTDRDERRKWATDIESRCSAQCVHSIGQVASFYRRHPEKPIIQLPR